MWHANKSANWISQPFCAHANSVVLAADLNADIVRAYLGENPECLERYLLSELSVSQIESLLDRKRAQQRQNSLRVRTVANYNNCELTIV